MASEKDEAQKHFDDFIKIYEAKYPKATKCLQKDRDVLLTFYDFPAEHWRHIRTTNPIESTFATVRLRTAKVRNCFSSKTVMTMAFQLCQCAQKRWIRLHHPEKLAEVIKGIKFVNGVTEIFNTDQGSQYTGSAFTDALRERYQDQQGWQRTLHG